MSEPTAEQVNEVATSAIVELLEQIRDLHRKIDKLEIRSPVKLLSIEEAAKQMSVSPKTVRKMIDAHRLPSVNVERRVLVPLSALEELATPAGVARTKRRPRRVAAVKTTEGELEKLAAARLARRAAR